MKRGYLVLFFLLPLSTIHAQNRKLLLERATQHFLSDSQMKYASLGFYVVDANTGEILIDQNGELGLAPASTQKTITSAAAFELLGSDFQYQTKLGYQGYLEKGRLEGNLILQGEGDPSLGSWRYAINQPQQCLNTWVSAIKGKGVVAVNGKIMVNTLGWEKNATPGGWIWEDLGNYYGAPAYGMNWRENQYDIYLKSGSSIGSTVLTTQIDPSPFQVSFRSEVIADAPGTGDQTNVFLAPGMNKALITGKIPINQSAFVISGSFPDPALQIAHEIQENLQREKIAVKGIEETSRASHLPIHHLVTIKSPSLDSLNYWFMQKSINLYGESFLKTIAFQKKGLGTTAEGLNLMKSFWKSKGIDPHAINMVDGSGLSPQNRVTPKAIVTVLQYAKNRDWFPSYLAAFPTNNQMKLKSGSIGGVRGYVGYHTNAEGKSYLIAMIVNNYAGSTSAIINKMFKVLDLLK